MAGRDSPLDRLAGAPFEIDHVGAVVHVEITSHDEWGASAQLFAESRDGRRVSATRGAMGAGGQRRGIAANLEEMLRTIASWTIQGATTRA